MKKRVFWSKEDENLLCINVNKNISELEQLFNYKYNKGSIKQKCLKLNLKYQHTNAITHGEIIKKIAEYNYILIKKVTNNGKSKYVINDVEGYYYFVDITSIKEYKLCKFHISNPYTIHNIKLWLKLNNKPFELLSDKYEGNKAKLLWKCLKKECNEIFQASWINIISETGCSYCAGKQVGLSNCLATKYPHFIAEWHPTKNGDLTPYDITYGSEKHVWWKCSNGHEWMQTPNNRTNIKCGCPECNKSKGEEKINTLFIKYNFIKIKQNDYDNSTSIDKITNKYFIYQSTFKDLLGIGNGLLSYDFYLPQYNLLIEYQGEQHERYIHGFHKSKKDFEKQLEHDRRKHEYAKNNNINLLVIWYKDFDSIEETLINNIIKAGVLSA